MAQKKTKRQTKTEAELQQQKKLKQRNNLIVIALFVVAVFIALSVYFCIEQLSWLAYVGKGLLGISIYLLPIALGYIAVSMVLPEKRVPTAYKIGACIALLMVAGMAFYLFSDGVYTKTLDLPLLWTGSVALQCGGVIEGLFAVPLIMIISRWGLGVILVAVALFAVLSLTDRTVYDLFSALCRLIKKGKPASEKAEEPEEVIDEPDVPTPPPAYPIENVVDIYDTDDSVDIPIETYEVENDGLDEDGQPIDTPTTPVATHHTVPISGVEAFTYDDVNPEHNIDPADIGKTEAELDVKAPEITDTPYPTEQDAEQLPLYVFPPVSLLQKAKYKAGTTKSEIEYNSKKLIETLHDFGVEAKMLGVSIGPNVTRYELQPKAGIKVSKITGLSDDIALSLAATQVRIEAPIPGKAAVGIEIPNQSASTVYIRDLIDSEDFTEAQSPLTVALGKDISGKNIYADLSKMPHLLVAGTTGSGKSVCINSILLSLLYKASPEDVKLILIDPKVIELNVYNKIPHLFIPVVTDPKKAAGALQWACSEMDRRYNLFTEFGTRDIGSYNAAVAESTDENARPLPRIVVVIDELADLMMVASKEVEEYICRLCQKARAAGIFLIIATQSPRVDVVTGLIKANVPSRIAFAVSSGIDSRVILDTVGAEKLLGKGDMLYFPIGANKPRRIQGCFVSDSEVEKVVGFIRDNVGDADYDDSAIQKIEEMSKPDSKASVTADGEDEDEMLMPAIECVVEAGMASTSFLQRKLKLGYSRAARLIDLMEEMGVVGPFEGSKPRSVKMTVSELQEMKLQRGAGN